MSCLTCVVFDSLCFCHLFSCPAIPCRIGTLLLYELDLLIMLSMSEAMTAFIQGSDPMFACLTYTTTVMSSTPFRPLSGLSRPTSNTARPRTVQSRSGTTRPGTSGRPLTAASTRHEGSYVIALLESRGIAHEVGIAAMDKDTGRVTLVQVLSWLHHHLVWVMYWDL